jgi:sulfate/thiosulfate transport system substrate-binding protein
MNGRRHVLSALATLALISAGCGGAADQKGAASAASKGHATVELVAYSTPELVYGDIIADFQRTKAGAGVRFEASYGPSGEQSRAVEAGLDADVVAFALAPDVERLVRAGLVSPDWADTEPHGLVSTSLVSFIVRKGNPKNVRSWDDLLQRDLEVVTANALTSGGAKWNILGAFAHGGLDYVERLITGHLKVQPRSAREALQTFLGGRGDVLISYESEAILAQRMGEEIDYVIPEDTVRVETPIAVTTAAPAAARAFVEFAQSKVGQRHFASWGYRPVPGSVPRASVPQFPTPARLATVADLGGWTRVDRELFDPEHGAVARIEERAEVSTAE